MAIPTTSINIAKFIKKYGKKAYNAMLENAKRTGPQSFGVPDSVKKSNKVNKSSVNSNKTADQKGYMNISDAIADLKKKNPKKFEELNKKSDTSKSTTKRKPVKGLSVSIKPKGVVDQDGNEIVKQPKKLKGIGTFKENFPDKAIDVPKASSNKSKPVGQTTKMRRQSAREDRVARRRAARTARKNFKQGIGTDQAQLDANIALEKERIKKRRAARNQYLRNFASQLARGEQAAARPSEYDKETDPAKMFAKNKEKIYNAKTDGQAATDKNAETEKTIIQDQLDKSGGDNQFMSFLGSTNMNLGNYGLGDSVKPASFGEFEKQYTGFPKLDTEDSTPQSAMRKLYNKKRGL